MIQNGPMEKTVDITRRGAERPRQGDYRKEHGMSRRLLNIELALKQHEEYVRLERMWAAALTAVAKAGFGNGLRQRVRIEQTRIEQAQESRTLLENELVRERERQVRLEEVRAEKAGIDAAIRSEGGRGLHYQCDLCLMEWPDGLRADATQQCPRCGAGPGEKPLRSLDRDPYEPEELP